MNDSKSGSFFGADHNDAVNMSDIGSGIRSSLLLIPLFYAENDRYQAGCEMDFARSSAVFGIPQNLTLNRCIFFCTIRQTCFLLPQEFH